ncbi:MAG: GGDEF domain-containing protein, partial [Oscillospiraceae bacterium]
MESNIVSIAEEKGFELMDAAKALQNNYKFQDAATALRKAADIFKDQGNHIFHVKSLNNLSVVLSYMGNESMAIDCFIEGMEYIKKNNCDYLSHIFYTNIGTKYQELGDYERCLYYYLMADNTMNEKGVLIPDWKYSESWRVAGSINLGYAYFYLKDYKNAEKNALLANEYQNKYSYGFFNISIAILLCRIQCVNGNLKYCDEEIPEILTSCKSLYSSLNDYTQDIASFVELARELKRDDVWKEILETYDSIVNARNAAPFHLKAVEFWLSYYESKNMEKEYMEYCIKYTRLSQKIQIEENKEKIAALNNKITLFKTKEEFKQAQNRSQIDELTLLGNRYALKCGGDMILKNMLETHAKLGVGILDLDDFKNLNDNYGHLAGDFALKTIGSILAKCMEGT